MRESVPPLIGNFIRYQVLSKTNPAYSEYSTSLSNAEKSLKEVGADMKNIAVKNATATSIIQSHLTELNVEITKNKKENGKLKKIINSDETGVSGSNEMISDSTLLYNTQYAKNAMMIVGIISIIVLCKKMK
jgi:hypothetical protein